MDLNRQRFDPRRGFTLMELLIVISIIILATAIAVPAVSKFTRGQSLNNAGRLIQSAFNEARRSAITSRKAHYLVMFHRTEENPTRDVFGFRVFQQGRLKGGGYTTDQYLLPSSINVQTQRVGVAGLYGILQESPDNLPAGVIAGSSNSGCRVAVFEDCPQPGQAQYAAIGEQSEVANWSGPYNNFFEFPAMRPVINSGDIHGWIQFRRDGTVRFEGGARDIPAHRIGDDSLYDLNINFQESLLRESEILADITLRQNGENKKRCYIDIDVNTGRIRYRVAALEGYSGTSGGVGTTTDPAGQ